MSKTFSVALTHMCGAEKFSEGVCLPRRITEYVSVPVLSRIRSSSQGAGCSSSCSCVCISLISYLHMQLAGRRRGHAARGRSGGMHLRTGVHVGRQRVRAAGAGGQHGALQSNSSPRTQRQRGSPKSSL